HKLHGGSIVVADLRKYEMAERSDVFFQPRAGSDIVWLNAVSKSLLDHDLADSAFPNERVNGLLDNVKSLE
ncbi:hypothetical protein, partial [Bacillus cereus]|uniref:hypothetical protein n=1 Tax=Bacillus cereus TaxID=1396 RepID=UPI0020BF8CE3